jgi:Putative prokaryotic signal transducing protein
VKAASPSACAHAESERGARLARLQRQVSPESDPEILAITAMLEAHDIPCYVRGGGIGGLLPGVQINGFNTRTIMIPEDRAQFALELLREFQSQSSIPYSGVRSGKSGRLRNLIEFFLFAWFVPRSQNCQGANSVATPNNCSSGREG